MKLVVIESPFAGALRQNMAYVRAAMRDCLRRNEAPYASHALYTQMGVLDDAVPAERRLGMEAGFAWGLAVPDAAVVFYVDLGWSNGMREGLARAQARGAHVRTRTLGAPWSDLAPSDAHLVPG